ncbi:MAG: ABC transporter substrate-binding protein, partial [Burkholderiaceae bacterium]
MTPTKRLNWIAFIFLAVLGYTQSVCAQDYPSRLIKIIVPISTGSTTDVVARIIAEAMRTAT